MPLEGSEGLLGLPLVVFRTVLEALHEADLTAMYSLRSTSKACRFECDALLFHSVKLQSHVYRNEDELRIDAMYGDVDLINLTDRKLEKATRGLVGCMLDGSGTITQHIQHLEICAIQQHLFETMIEPALKSLLLSHTNLQSLSWNANIPIPEDILDIFHATHPTARIHVTNCARERKPMDCLLLSSPQLHSLRLNVYFDAPYVHPFVNGPSELQILKQCLIRGNSIKVLHIALEYVDKMLYGKIPSSLGVQSWEDGPLNFHWQDGDLFPALEEWRWSGRTEYVFSEQQFNMWHRCMDWNRLRTLDFGFQPITTMLPFKALAGRVPRLNRLSVAISSYYDADQRHVGSDILILEEFLHNVESLQKLKLRWRFLDDSLPMILHHQGHCIQELDIWYDHDSDPWDHNRGIDLLTQAPQLQFLRIMTNKAPNPTVDLQGRWRGHAVNLTPHEKWTGMTDVGIEKRAQKAKQHADVMERVRKREQSLMPPVPEPAPEPNPEEIAFARSHPLGGW